MEKFVILGKEEKREAFNGNMGSIQEEDEKAALHEDRKEEEARAWAANCMFWCFTWMRWMSIAACISDKCIKIVKCIQKDTVRKRINSPDTRSTLPLHLSPYTRSIYTCARTPLHLYTYTYTSALLTCARTS